MKSYYVQFLCKAGVACDAYKDVIIKVGEGECPLGKAHKWIANNKDSRVNFIRITMFNYLGEV